MPGARRALGGEIGIAGVPYIHCPGCRLTVYGGIAYRDDKQCPRCGCDMSERPGPLFRSLRLDRGLPRTAAPPEDRSTAPPRGFSAAA
jgi:hypothetical protein